MLSNLKAIRFLLTASGRNLLFPLFVLGWVVFLWECSPPSLAQPVGGVLAIRGATLIDGTGRPPAEEMTIVTRDGRIEAIGPTIPVPADARVIDGTGKTVLPGLIDAHVHLNEWMIPFLLKYGVTTIVDCGNLDEWIVALKGGFAKKKFISPRIYGTGSRLGASPSVRRRDLLTLPAHLAWSSGRRVERARKPHFLNVDVNSARNLIGRKKDLGLDAIKIDESWTKDDLASVVLVARDLELPVLGHAFDAKESVEAGVNMLVHMEGVAKYTIGDPQKLEAIRRGEVLNMYTWMDSGRFDELIALMIKNNTWLNPTIQRGHMPKPVGLPDHRYWDYEKEDLAILNDPGAAFVPLDARIAIPTRYRRFGTDSRRFVGEEFQDVLSTADRAEIQKGYDNALEFIRRFAAAGGKISAGTDTVSSYLPGISLHRELEILVEAGLTPLQALQTATKNPSDFFRLNEVGSLEVGHRADLIVVDGNPAKNIRDLSKISMVILDGQILDTKLRPDYTFPLRRPYAEDTGTYHRVPGIIELEPLLVDQSGEDFVLTIRGFDFMSVSVVELDGRPLATEFVNKEELKASVPGHLRMRAGTHFVTVRNPRPRGGTSNEMGLIVSFR